MRKYLGELDTSESTARRRDSPSKSSRDDDAGCLPVADSLEKRLPAPQTASSTEILQQIRRSKRDRSVGLIAITELEPMH